MDYSTGRVRVAAISFLNPAPLLWDFEHGPRAIRLRERYDVSYTLPSHCAAQLRRGDADLGLIPIAALATLPNVRAVPGCTIASLQEVRSIQLVLKPGIRLQTAAAIAVDAASRSSAAYLNVILKTFYGAQPKLEEHTVNLSDMLHQCDGALLIGDPALLALQLRDEEGAFEDCTWIDLAALWRQHTGLPWVAAVWAVRMDVFDRRGTTPQQLCKDLIASRDGGLKNIDTLVEEWQPRLALPAGAIRGYLSSNIHYRLDEPCLQGIDTFFRLAEAAAVLPRYRLQLL